MLTATIIYTILGIIFLVLINAFDTEIFLEPKSNNDG